MASLPSISGWLNYAAIGACGIAALLVLKRAALAARERNAAAAARTRMAKQRHGIVYLYLFKRPADVIGLSPFGTTVETFLRLCNIPHEVIEATPQDSPTGRLPYMELNGEGTADSVFIMRRLQREFPEKAGRVPKTELHRALSTVIGRFMFRAMKLHSARHYWVDNVAMALGRIADVIPLPLVITRRFVNRMRQQQITMLNTEGHGDLSDAEYHEQFLEEMKAIEAIVGAFEAHNSADRLELSPEAVATLFAWLESMWHLPECPAVRHLHASKVLRKFLAATEATAFPDVDKLLPKRPKPGYLADA